MNLKRKALFFVILGGNGDFSPKTDGYDTHNPSSIWPYSRASRSRPFWGKNSRFHPKAAAMERATGSTWESV
jgi:hypothetical protein